MLPTGTWNDSITRPRTWFALRALLFAAALPLALAASARAQQRPQRPEAPPARGAFAGSAVCPGYAQGFETDTDGWNVFTSPDYDIVRVPSGTHGVVSAHGAWHAEGLPPSAPAGNWGGFGAICGCSSTACAASVFPAGGYRTQISVWLDVDGGWDDDTRFDWVSAVGDPFGAYRRDFVFNVAYLDASDPAAPGAGSNRFVIAASNTAPGFPQGGVDPVAVTESGWYLLRHSFRDAGGVLACDMSISGPDGGILATWTLSDPSDVIGVTVGGNRYGWLAINQFPYLALDDARRTSGPESGTLVLSVPDCPDDADPAPGTQVAVDLSMILDDDAMGFAAFVEYDLGTLAYRGDLSSYTATPFPLHVTPIVQPDDGRLELDGSTAFAAPATNQDAPLAHLVFDVLAECGTGVPIGFETGGTFPSELSNLGVPVPTTLVIPDPFTLDDTPPVLSACPADITVPADAVGCAGAVVTFADPTATDNCDPSPVVTCTPPSGSFFPVGTTTVTCTALDACGNTASCSFDVEVTPTNLVEIEIELAGVIEPVTRCIRFVPDPCGAPLDIPVSFIDHDFDGGAVTPVRGMLSFEVPCGLAPSLCAKDRQHTLWGTIGLVPSMDGTTWLTDGVLSLAGGDSDDDGDVDINDVSFYLSQFGNLAADGGCPWDGTTRDSDWSNNGAVLSEDYAFLVANWLATSSCPCALVVARGGGGTGPELKVRALTPVSKRADLDGNGIVDDRDVELFEIRNGLSGELSRRMRASRR